MIPDSDIMSVDHCCERAQRLAEHVVELWNCNHMIVCFHEAHLRKRWLKKSGSERKAILLEAWHNMSARYRQTLNVGSALAT